MNRPAVALPSLLLALSIVLPLAARAADSAGIAPPVAAPAADTAASAPARREPAVQRTVVEDNGVRIEELRVRGQNQRITVQSKALGAAPYEIITPDGARDMSQARGGAAGHSVWHLFGF
jgi:hypothetical protein